MRWAVEGGEHPTSSAPSEALKTASPLPHSNNRGGGARAERAGTGRSAARNCQTLLMHTPILCE
jgi:hypothetical protein